MIDFELSDQTELTGLDSTSEDQRSTLTDGWYLNGIRRRPAKQSMKDSLYVGQKACSYQEHHWTNSSVVPYLMWYDQQSVRIFI